MGFWGKVRRCAAAAVCVMSAVWASSAAAQVPAVPLRPGEDAPPLVDYVRYIEPATAGDVALVGGDLPAERLRRVASRDIQFGTAGTRVLAFVRVRNVSPTGGSWIFTTGRGTLNEFAMYRIDRGGRASLLIDGSNETQVRENLQAYQSFSHELALGPGEEAILALYFRSEGSSWMPLEIQTFESFFADRRENLVLVASVVAGALILILFNVIFYSITGKREFAWLGAAQLVFTANTLHAEGYLTILALHEWPLVAGWIGEILRSFYAVLMVQFGRAFLQTRQTFPRTDRLMRAAIALGLLFVAASLAGIALGQDGWTELRIAAWAYLGIVSLALPFVAIAAYVKLGRQYWPLVLSWASVGAVIAYGAVAMSGIVTGLPITWHLVGPVGLLECMLATLALGLHLRTLERERLAAGAALEESLRRQVATSREAARLAQDRASALATVRDQDRLIHASRHDTRQVLVALNAVADYASAHAGKPIPDSVLDMIRSSAAYLRDIVDTTRAAPVLSFDGSSVVALGLFAADQPLRQLEKIYMPLLARKGVALQVEASPGLELLSDRSLLARALSNLVSNAVRFTDKGSVRLFTQMHGRHIRFGVVDTGPGIPPALLQAFEAGTAEALQSADGLGSGSGLRIAAAIADALQGSLVLRAGAGGGTQAWLSVPMAQPASAMRFVGIDELRTRLAGMQVVDLDDATSRAGLVTGGAMERAMIGVSSDATAQTRDLARSAGLSLILLRPLAPSLADHPVLAALTAAPDPVP